MGNKVTMDIIAGVSVDSTGLIASMSSRGTGARSSVGVNSGKVYFEVYVTGTPNVGLCDETMNLNSTGWPTESSFVIQGGTLNFYIGSTYYAYTNPNTASANNPYTVGLALDMDNYVVSVYFNGVLTMDSLALEGKISNLGTKLYPFLFHGGGGDRRGTAEWNFGATPFGYPIPAGYTAYDGNQGNVNKYLLKNDEGYKTLTELVSTTFPTEEQFKEKGMKDMPSYNQLTNFNGLVTYSTDNLSKSLVKFKPKEKTVLSSGAINFSGKKLKKVSLIGTDNARVLFSKDRGETWCNTTSNVVSEIKNHDDGTVIGTGEYIRSSTEREVPWKAFSLPEYSNINTVFSKGGNYWYDVNHNNNYTDHSWIRYEFKEEEKKAVNMISFAVSSNRRPKDYVISGSNDGVSYITLYTGIVPPPDKISEVRVQFNNKVQYRYVRIDILNTTDTYMPTSPIIGKILFYGDATPVSLSDISTQGLTPTQLSAITPDEWKTFMGDSSSLRFAYYLPDETANTDKLELTVDFVGE